MGEVAGDDDGAGQRQARLDRMLRQRGENFAHRLVEVDPDDIAAKLRLVDIRQVLGRIGLQRLQEDAIPGDLALGLAIGRAGDAEADRQRGAVARQADDAHVMAEILAAELRADAERLRHLVDLFLHFEVAEGVARRRALGRQRVEIFGRGELHRLEVLLGRGAADDDGEMVGRTGGGAERQDLLLQERHHAVLGEKRWRRLVEEGLVGRAAALADEEELVGVLTLGIDVDLRRQVGRGVLLLEHRERRELRIAQVALEIGVRHALAERGLVLAVGPDLAALLAHDDGGAGVLAHRQHAAGRDIGVLQQIIGDELVVRGRLGIVENLAELGEMAGAQQMVDVDEGLFGELADRLARDAQDLAVADLLDADALAAQLAIRRRVLAEREEIDMRIGHDQRLRNKLRRDQDMEDAAPIQPAS